MQAANAFQPSVRPHFSIDEIIAGQDARAAAIEQFIRANESHPFSCKSKYGYSLVISRCISGDLAKWRITSVDADGPYSHREVSGYSDAVKQAAGDFYAVLDTARFLRPMVRR